MESNKLVETEKVKKKSHHFTDELNEILPVDTVLAVLGGFFTVCSIIYLLVKAYVPKEHHVLVISISGLVTFLIMWVIFNIVAYRKRKKQAAITLQEQKEKLVKQLHFCKECSIKKINDGFAYRKLLKEENIEDVEAKMGMDLKPEECNILVYTSDLATLIRRLKVIKTNIEDHHITYRVIYFKDHSQKQRETIVNLIGEKNLIDANNVPLLRGSKDFDFMRINDTELIIYLDSSSYIQGFLSVDNVPSNAIAVGRPTHFAECINRCNYGHSYSDGVVKEPFYKSLNKEKTRTLYLELSKLFEGGNE